MMTEEGEDDRAERSWLGREMMAEHGNDDTAGG